MSWFQLDASTIACRVQAEGDAEKIPTFRGSLLRGAAGFTTASLAAFVPWAVFGGWFLGRFGEGGMLGACAAVFILLSGPLLHRLIIGPGSLLIFYKLFTLALAAYAVAWLIGWTCLGGDLGNGVGLFAGALVMGWMLTRAFEQAGVIWKVVLVLFLLSALGAFGGGWVEERVLALGAFGLTPVTQATIARILWAVCFSAGFGAGLGLAFYFCQADVRELLRAESARHPAGAEK